MKKILLLLILGSVISAKTWAQTMASPFYMPPKKVSVSTTELEYQKLKIKPQRTTIRTKTLFQNLTYGLSDTASLVLQASNEWNRLTLASGKTDRQDKSIDWSIGGLYDLYHTENYLLHLRVFYLQQENHFLYDLQKQKGEYKALQANIRTGYDLEWLLPYLGGQIEQPIIQKKQADNRIKVEAYAGLFKDFGKIALDEVITYRYDRLNHSKRLNLQTGLTVSLSEKIMIGTYFDYLLNGKNNRHEDDHETTLKAQLKIQF